MKLTPSLLFTCFLISVSSLLFAQSISINTAKEIAKNHLLSVGKINLKSASPNQIKFRFSSLSVTSENKDTLYFVLSDTINHSFVIVAADKRSRPIIGYSLESSYNMNNQPPAFVAWMENRKQEIESIKKNNLLPDSATVDSWQNLSLKSSAIETASIEPLIQTQWDQGCYYNSKCPSDAYACGHVPTGCVATAMAQIMKYWNYPTKGTGSHSYTHPKYGNLSADFGSTTYQWSQMPNQVTSQNDAVANLMYHCGVSVDMGYQPIGSFASDPRDELVKYFNYSPNAMLINRNGFPTNEWTNVLKSELDLRHPIWYMGSGDLGSHVFVCDGYQNVDYFHFNWGWSGLYDGYFYIGNLNPSGWQFNMGQNALINILPGSLPDGYNGFFLSSNSLDIATKGGSTSVDVFSSANWTASCNQSWLSLNTNTGVSGKTTLTLTAAEYQTGSDRSATVTISAEGFSDQLIPVNQFAKVIVTSGGLRNLISKNVTTITRLTLAGTIDARDFKTMRDAMPRLTDLDLSDVTIVAYTGNEGTESNLNSTYQANKIPSIAFSNKTHLATVILPSSVTSIGDFAFLSCDKLTTVTIPSSVISIGNDVFNSCSALINVDTSNPNYSSIDGVLFNKNQTTIIHCPISKTGSYTIPSLVTSIGNSAFLDCSGLTNVFIPSSVISIEYAAFFSCSALINVDTSNPNYSSIDGILLNKTRTTIFLCPISKTGNYTIPSSVTEIGNMAFNYCNNLTVVTIPSSVTSIGKSAFINCIRLNTIYAKSSSPVNLSSSPNVFFNINKTTCVIHVPYGTRTAYQTADQWKDFTNIVENNPPLANAGVAQSISENNLSTLDGSASSDLDNDALTYLWTAPVGIILSSNTAQKPTFTAPEVISDTNYTFFLTVNDGWMNSNADQIVFTVKQVNKAPTANAGTDQSVNENCLCTLDGSTSTDPDNDVLTYLWTAPPGITLSSKTVSKPTFTAPEVTTDTKYTFSLMVNDGLLNSSADQIVVTIKQINKAPIANAGTDQSVNENSLCTLDCSTSSDPDNDGLTYLWTAPEGITLSSKTAQKPTFTAPEVTTDTQYTFTLTVNDGSVNSSADQIVVTVKQVNKAPTANAGTDQSVNENSLCTLDGSASSDPDKDVLTYLWTAPAGITLSSNTAQKPTFTSPEVTTDTQYTFLLTVNDGLLNSNTDQIVVTVKQINKAPTANAGTDQSVNENSLCTLDGSSSSDPDKDVLTYLWTAPAGITLSSNTASKPTFIAPEVTTDTKYTFSLTVNDGWMNSSANQIIVTVKQINKAPTANAGTDQTVNENSLCTLDGSASTDPDNDALTYLWTAPAGITLSSNTASKPTFIAPEVTTDTKYTFSLTVNDGWMNSSADQIIVTVKQINKAPTANAGTDQTVNENSLCTLDGSASTDPDNDALTYLWTAPAGFTLSSNTAQKPTFTAPEVTIDTKYTFSLMVNDGLLNSSADQIVVTVKQVNKAPTANAGADQSINENSMYTLDGSASSDPDKDALTYLWTAPPRIILSSETVSKPTFTAKEVSTDTNYTFSLIVSDGFLNSIADKVVITIKNVDKAPYVINQMKDISVDKRAPDQTVDLQTVFADDDFADVLSYNVTSNTNSLVVIAKITDSYLSLSFSSQYTGSSEIVITANSNGKEVTSKFNVEVKIPAGIDPFESFQNLKMYPNPTNGKIKIVFDQIPQNGMELIVTDLTGKTILKQIIQEREGWIDLTGNLPGLYLLKTNLENTNVKKIILK